MTETIFEQYVHERIEKKNKNFLMVICGETGSGKSYSALKIAERLDPKFSIDRVVFSAIDFMTLINQLVQRSKEGEDISGFVIIWDELGATHGSREFMTTSNKAINHFFQLSRHLNLIVLLTVPLLSFIDSATRKLCHCVGEMTGINRTKKMSTMKIKMVQTNVLSGKEYPKYLRYNKEGSQFVYKKLSIGLPNKELIEVYEIKKENFAHEYYKDIEQKLIAKDKQDKQTRKPLTPRQQEIGKLLLTKSIDEAAKILNITLDGVYRTKAAIEAKGYAFKPIWEAKHIVRWEIEGLD